MRNKIATYSADKTDWRAAIATAIATTLFFSMIACVDFSKAINKDVIRLAKVAITSPSQEKLVVIAVTCIVGAMVAAPLPFILVWVVLGLSFAATISLVFGTKVADYTWLIPAFGLLFSGGSVLLIRYIDLLRQRIWFGAQLNGIIPEASLDHLVKNPEQFNNADRQVSATVVAVQIVGIENIRRRYSPEDTYFEMRRLNGVVERVAHKLQGLKLRGYRDGFCIVFGDQLRKGSSAKWHTELALQAASEIHLLNAREVESAVNGKRPVFVLRVGVSSARVLLGNAGDSSALDITVIGEAYDDARRFERACEVNSVLFGRMTRDLLVKIDASSPAFTRKVINMDKTGGSDMQEVFEFDPFYQHADLRKQAMTALRMSAKFERKDERFAARANSGVVVDTNFGDAQLINFSRNGIGLMMKAPLANGTTVRVGLRSNNPVLSQRLSNRSLNDLHAEVRWSRPSGEEQLMGLKYKSIEEADRDFLLQCLIEHHESLEPRRA